MTDAQRVAAFRALVVEESGWCGGQRETAADHVSHIVQAVAGLLRMTEAELAAFYIERQEGRQLNVGGRLI